MNKTNPVGILKEVPYNLEKPLAVFGGFLIGKFAGNMADKFIESKRVSGFLGALSDNTRKFVKPAVITVTGVGISIMGKQQKKDIITYGGLGVATAGLNELFNAVVPSQISGLLGNTELPQNFPSDEPFLMSLPSTNLNLPELEVSGVPLLEEDELLWGNVEEEMVDVEYL